MWSRPLPAARAADVRALLPLSRLPAADRERIRDQRPDRGGPGRAARRRAPEPVTVPTDSLRPHDIYRCPHCWTALWSDYGRRLSLLFVRVGTLDDAASLPPDVHIFTRTKLPWVRLPEGARAFESIYKIPKVWSRESLERLNLK